MRILKSIGLGVVVLISAATFSGCYAPAYYGHGAHGYHHGGWYHHGYWR